MKTSSIFIFVTVFAFTFYFTGGWEKLITKLETRYEANKLRTELERKPVQVLVIPGAGGCELYRFMDEGVSHYLTVGACAVAK